MPQTATYGLPYPALTDAPNVPGDMQALAARVEAVMSLAAVTSTSAVTSPVAGQVVFALDTLRAHRYTGSAWVPLNPNMPACVLINTQAQQITNNIDSFAQFDTVEEQTTISGNTMAATGTPGTITIREDGLYGYGFRGQWSVQQTGGDRRCGITRNNGSPGYSLTTSIAYDSKPGGGIAPPQGLSFQCTGQKRLVTGDVLRPVVTQSSGNNLWIESSGAGGANGGGPARFWAWKIRD